jgi:hypothetical protein
MKQLHLVGMFFVFAGKLRCWISPSKGSERPVEQSPHLDVTRGQKLEAKHNRLGEGRHVGIHTWRHLIGTLKK